MNIFVLDEDITKCAQYHLDKHCVKMVLETTQLLNTALIYTDPLYDPAYKLTHKNHPSAIWARESRANFKWLNDLGLALCKEYTFRYEKTHKCEALLIGFQKNNAEFSKEERTPFALCMPDEYKTNNPVSSYRNYYLGAKAEIAVWTKREIPYWWKNNGANIEP